MSYHLIASSENGPIVICTKVFEPEKQEVASTEPGEFRLSAFKCTYQCMDTSIFSRLHNQYEMNYNVVISTKQIINKN